MGIQRSRWLVAVVCIGLSVQVFGASAKLEQALPADTLAIVSFPDLGASAGRFQDTALGKIWREPEVQEFFGPLLEKLRQKAAEAQGGPAAQAMGLLDVKFGQIALALLPPDPQSPMPVPRGVLVVEAREGIQQIEALVGLAEGVLQAKLGLQPMPALVHQGVQIDVVGNPFFSLCTAVDGQRLLVTTSQALMTEVIDGLRQPRAGSLAASPAMALLRDRLHAEPEAFLLINVEAVLNHYEPLLMQKMPPDAAQALDALGLRGLTSVAVGVAFDGAGVREVVSIRAPGERRGLLAFLDQPVGEKTLISRVPRDAMAFSASRLNLSEQYAHLMALVRDVDADTHDQFVAQIGAFENQYALSIQDDVVDAIGNEMVLYYRFPTELILLFKVRKPASISKVLDMGLGLAASASPPRWRGRDAGPCVVTFQGHDVHYAPVRVEDVVLWPAYAIMDDVCVVALAPQTVKSVIGRAGSGPSILDSSEYRAALGKVSGQHVSVDYSDPRAVVEVAYAVASYGLQWASNQPDFQDAIEFGLDLGRLPRKEAIVQHLFPSVSCYTVDNEGFVLESYSGFPGSSLLVSGSLGLSMALPRLMVAREQARRTVSMSRLKQMGIAVHVYAADNDGKLPPKGKEAESLAQGYLPDREQYYHPSRKQAPVEGFPDNIDYQFSQTLPERIEQIQEPSQTPLAWERRSFSKRGRRCVVFLDGHVETVGRGRFRQFMREGQQGEQ